MAPVASKLALPPKHAFGKLITGINLTLHCVIKVNRKMMALKRTTGHHFSI
jgi:hypothetical protein